MKRLAGEKEAWHGSASAAPWPNQFLQTASGMCMQALDTTHARPPIHAAEHLVVCSLVSSLYSHPTRRPACPKQSLNGNMSTTTRLHFPETTTAFAANRHRNDHRSQYFAPSAALRVRVAATPLLSTPPLAPAQASSPLSLCDSSQLSSTVDATTGRRGDVELERTHIVHATSSSPSWPPRTAQQAPPCTIPRVVAMHRSFPPVIGPHIPNAPR